MQTVGKVYAEALFSLAREERKEQQVYEELNQAADLMLQNPGFSTLLDVPTLRTEERIEVLRKVIGDKPGITENFLCLLVEKHRFGRLSEIREAYNKQYHEAFGIAEVFVTSAVPLDESQRSALKTKLQKKLGKTIQLRERVDSTLIGGMVVQYGDTRMDHSIRTRMKQFKQES
ncbi:MAG: F0F1 ATP synthase subunit delta [Oscillospiraceae bacterium]|nr:F0F1 ATP synthase subunit delta [Oscillospiraceae bacterium]